MSQQAHLYITDKSGKKYYNTSVTYGWHDGELRNMQRRVSHDIKFIPGLDVASARIVMTVNGVEVDPTGVGQYPPVEFAGTDDELLRELME